MQPPTAVHSSSSTAPAGLDKFFIPARSTRHRIAAIALYRALIALASSVPLPPDLTEAWNKTQTPRRRQPEAPARNPLVELVRRTFKRNRADTSPRIVAPALHAGYRSLELLRDAAKTEGTPSRDQVVGLVREQLAIRQRSHDARQAWLERHPPPPEDSDQSTEPHHDDQHRDKPRPLPLLVRISPDPTPENPFPRIQYATPNHPRPQSELGGSGRRYVPHVDMANDFAILRRRRPQDHGFSNVLRRKMDRRGVRMALYKEMQEIDVPDARLEDEWDDAMRELVEDELLLRAAERRGGGGGGGGGGQRHESHTGGSSVTPAEQHLSRVLLDIVQEQEQQQQHHHQQQQHSSSSADPLPSSSSSSSSPFPSSPSSTATFAATASHHGKAYLERKMSREAEDALARSAALHALVASERALAAREKVERDAARRAGWEAKMAAEHGESGWRGVVAREKAARDEARGRRIEMATRAALQSWGGGGGGTGEDDDRGERSAAASAVVVEGRMWRRHVPRVYMDKSEFLLQLKQAPGGRGGSGSGSGGRGDRKESYAGKRPSGGKGDGGNRGTKTGDGWRQPRKDGDHQHNRASGGPGGGGKRGPHDGNMGR